MTSDSTGKEAVNEEMHQSRKAHGSRSVGLRSGADETRTHNLLDATEALSQLSYCPVKLGNIHIKRRDPATPGRRLEYKS